MSLSFPDTEKQWKKKDGTKNGNRGKIIPIIGAKWATKTGTKHIYAKCSGPALLSNEVLAHIPEFFQAGMKDATIEALNGVILVLRKTRMDNLGSLLEVDIKSASNEALASLFDTEDVSSTQCATVYSQSKTNAIAEKGLSISSKLLEVGRLAPLAIKAELPGTARKMSLIVMDLIKSTLETIYDRMKSNVDEAFIQAVMDEMKSKKGASPMRKK